MAVPRIVGAALAGVLIVTSVLAQSGAELFVDAPPASTAAKRDQASRLKQLRAEAGAAGLRVVQIQLPLLAETGKPITFNLPGTSLSATGGIDDRSGDSYTWVGKIDGDPLSSVILVVRGDRVTGDVRVREGLFRITPLGNGSHALFKVDESRLPRDDAPSRAKKDKKAQAPKTKATPFAASKPEPSARSYLLKVLVAYTEKVQLSLTTDILSEIDLAEKQANISYKNSNVNIRLKVVASYKTAYQESGNASVDINMPEVLAKREEHGADIAVLVVSQLDSVGSDGERTPLCGRARGIGVDYRRSFSVVKASCMGAKPTFAHEIGHLLGARHNWEEDTSDTPCGTYGHGLYNIAGRWRTVMAYDCPLPGAEDVCRRKLYWSNPHAKYEDGAPLGDRDFADNARCLREMVPKFCVDPAPCAKAPD